MHKYSTEKDTKVFTTLNKNLRMNSFYYLSDVLAIAASLIASVFTLITMDSIIITLLTVSVPVLYPLIRRNNNNREMKQKIYCSLTSKRFKTLTPKKKIVYRD